MLYFNLKYAFDAIETKKSKLLHIIKNEILSKNYILYLKKNKILINFD